MTEEKNLSLIWLLDRRTREGRLKWEQVPGTESLRSRLGDYHVVLRSIPDREFPNDPDFEVEIQDALKKPLDRFTNISLREHMEQVNDEGLNPYQALRSLYERARRQALGVDTAIDDLLKILKE